MYKIKFNTFKNNKDNYIVKLLSLLIVKFNYYILNPIVMVFRDYLLKTRIKWWNFEFLFKAKLLTNFSYIIYLLVFLYLYYYLIPNLIDFYKNIKNLKKYKILFFKFTYHPSIIPSPITPSSIPLISPISQKIHSNLHISLNIHPNIL